MMMDDTKKKRKVLKANIAYHSALAKTYDLKQPHYRPENVARVDRILAGMAAKTGGGSLVDLGCGTGFITNIAKKYFRSVVGVDITPMMLKLMDPEDGQVGRCLAETDHMPFHDDEFDACTAYGFLHHLYDLHLTLREAHRCLRPGGILFSDQDPNYHYWQVMDSLKERSDLTEIIQREVRSVAYVSEDISKETGLSTQDIALAEFQKVAKGGFDPDRVVMLMEEVGFQSVTYRYEWFLGQGKLHREQSAKEVQVIDNFLRGALPTTRHLFKYLSFFAEKRG
jgi:ubiquinone/menaquinone biosynthesis C-methylase UbiE